MLLLLLLRVPDLYQFQTLAPYFRKPLAPTGALHIRLTSDVVVVVSLQTLLLIDTAQLCDPCEPSNQLAKK